MSETVEQSELTVALDEFHAALDHLAALDLTRYPTEELLDGLRGVERARRRHASVESGLIGEVESRGLPGEHGCRSTGQFLRHLLRIDPGEAHGRAKNAAAVCSRVLPCGERVAPLLPAVAAAQAVGDISARHAAVIEKTLTDLPDPVQDQHGQQIEGDLVDYATRFDPTHLALLARRMSDIYDPDGVVEDDDKARRRRDLSLRKRADGSGRLDGDLTPECTERLECIFDSLAAPHPAKNGEKDPRTAGQRRHDALLAALEAAQRAGKIPTAGGISATIVVTMDWEAYLTGRGLACTGHGSLVPASQALHWGGGDIRLLAVAMNSMNEITAYSTAHRLFTENQRLAITARDGGCSFPNCPAPPGWCQTHHVNPHSDGGATTVANGTLVCGHHHREHQKQGWTCTMTNGQPHWTPPAWIDPQQTPRRNHLHHAEIDLNSDFDIDIDIDITPD